MSGPQSAWRIVQPRTWDVWWPEEACEVEAEQGTQEYQPGGSEEACEVEAEVRGANILSCLWGKDFPMEVGLWG